MKKLNNNALRGCLVLFFILVTVVHFNCKKTKKSSTPPTISAVDPTSGIIGDAVTIKGSNLEGVDNVYFNGTASKIINFSGTEINTVVPAGLADGTANITVRSEGGTSNQLPFLVIKTPVNVDVLPPTLSRVYPAVSYNDYPVLVYGDNLSGTIKITFNDKDAVIFTNNKKIITTTIPKTLPAGKVTVKVTTTKGTSSIDLQTLGVPATPSTANFSIVSVPPPNYVPSISNNWDCGLFSRTSEDDKFVYFVDLNTDIDGNGVNYNVTGKYKYTYNKQAGYNTENYIEIIDHAEKDTLVGQFSSKFNNPCVLEMVLMSSKTKRISICRFDIRSNFPDANCDK
ncbi:IPT/TIG domain-containing protein [Pedobacter sp. V48]|uniref:IPT/TIG domain-containing protein n=1 Tax=Pedobacter sp. V48 TaxID=509635 RepID=UPI0004B6C433|nr:IPT/TIG domain-containing protein [Pedobacter sp. V48]